MNTSGSTAKTSMFDPADAIARDTWVIPLPANVRDNDARLRTTVNNLLELPGVRSVIVDVDRRQAVVRLHASRPPAPPMIEVPASVFLEQQLGEEGGDTSAASIVSWIDPRDQSWCFIALPANASGLRRVLLLITAGLSLALGFLGIVLPGLPTTPFVLVASYCLLRSSPALHARLIHSRLFGGVLRDWHLHRGIRPHIRYKALVVVLLVLTASLALTNLPLAVKLAIVAVAACGIAYIWRLPDVAEPPPRPAA